jgi:hypothetical protein
MHRFMPSTVCSQIQPPVEPLQLTPAEQPRAEGLLQVTRISTGAGATVAVAVAVEVVTTVLMIVFAMVIVIVA